MTQHCHCSTAAAIVAAEPDENTPKRSSARPDPVDVEVRHRRSGKLSWLSKLSCSGRGAISDSVHFHASHVEDSVHVMIKHDRTSCQKRGQPEKAYTPRAPLSERLASARKLEAARKQASHATIQAEEDDGEDGDDILAAVTKADCVS